MFNSDRKGDSSQQRGIEDRYVLNPDDRQYYVDMFKLIVNYFSISLFSQDSDKDGYISRDQAARYFSQNRLPKKVFEQLFLMCDCDKDGFLDLQEFIYAGHIAYVHQSVFSLFSK